MHVARPFSRRNRSTWHRKSFGFTWDSARWAFSSLSQRFPRAGIPTRASGLIRRHERASRPKSRRAPRTPARKQRQRPLPRNVTARTISISKSGTWTIHLKKPAASADRLEYLGRVRRNIQDVQNLGWPRADRAVRNRQRHRGTHRRVDAAHLRPHGARVAALLGQQQDWDPGSGAGGKIQGW